MKFLPILFFLGIFLADSSLAFDHNHARWDMILNRYVVVKGHQSFFNYKRLKSKRSGFDSYLSEMSMVSKKEYDTFTSKQKLAFLINAYNAFTVKLIIDNYPVKSIKDLGSLFSSPWKKKFFKLLGEKNHLDYIEHDLIRKNFKEPRIHMAVVCASIGCPSLQNRAFTSENLEQLLESGVKNFLRNESKNALHGKQLKLSKIFKWYGGDFEKTHGSVANFIASYITNDKMIQKEIATGKYEIDYTDYNWDLNEWK